MKFFKSWNQNPRRCKSQTALEYMMVASIALLMLIPIIIDGWKSTAQLENNINIQLAQDAISQISDAAKTVYFQGAPSSITIRVNFPEKIILANTSGKEIYFRMKYKDSSTDIVGFLDFNVTGNISNISGVHEIYLEALPNVVNITQKS